MSGLHRTYIGQIERGEKNISFDNLVKIAGVFEVTLAELMSGLEDGGAPLKEAKRESGAKNQRSRHDAVRQLLETQRLVKKLKLQHAALERTIEILEKISNTAQVATPPRGNSDRQGRR